MKIIIRYFVLTLNNLYISAKYDIPSLQLFKKIGWLSIQNRLEYHKNDLMYKKL
jgi:hypothetical protein